MGKHGCARFFVALAMSTSAVTFVCSTAARAPAEDGTELLQRHRQYVGWQFGDPAFHFVRATWLEDETTNGKTQTAAHVTTIRANVVFRTTAVDAKTQFETDSGYTGNIFWTTNQNGFIRPIIGDAEKAMIAREVVLNEAATSLPGTFKRTEAVDGVETSVVHVQPENADGIDLYIDPSSGAYKRVVIDPDGPYQAAIDIVSYKPVRDGKRVISAYKTRQGRYTFRLDTIELPQSIDAQAFAPPKQTATWHFDPSHAAVPLTLNWYRQRRIYFTAKINGVDGKFILDTGAGAGIVFTKSFADKLKLKQLKSSQALGVGGSVITQSALVDSITIGGNTLSHVAASFQDTALDADGLMGFDLFAGVVAHVDLDKLALTLYDPSTDISTLAHGVSATVDLENGIPAVPMKMNGRIDVNAQLDTGNPLFMLFPRGLIYSDHVRMYRRAAFVRGIAGYELDECGTIDSLTMGPIDYTGVAACASPSYTGHNILVGLDFIRHFNLWFDYPRSAMVFEPRASVPDP